MTSFIGPDDDDDDDPGLLREIEDALGMAGLLSSSSASGRGGTNTPPPHVSCFPHCF